jgi:ubiquinone biosynthesis protein Coq4
MDDKMKEALRQASKANIVKLQRVEGQPSSLEHLNNVIDTNEKGRKALEQSRVERGIKQDQDK